MLNILKIPPSELFALLAAVGFAAGLNLYATVAVLGCLARFGHLPLPPGLQLLASWPVIAASVALFGIEFFADKIPAFDLIWNALHTFIRIPVAALLAYVASSHLSPGLQLASAAAGGLIAFAAHSGKIALRTAVTPSPEPFSNMALSFGEDATSIGLTWIATQHPYIAAGIVAVLLIALVLVMRWVIRALRRFFKRARTAWRSEATLAE
jgi:hypothetical protein